MPGFRKGRAGRLARLGGLAARLGGSAASALGTRLTSGPDRAAETLHRRTAEQLLATMGTMKGLPMKVGQILSFMDGVVPPEYQGMYADLLARLQTRAQPLPWTDMGPELERELGPSLDTAFSFFDEQPIAAASIGQVYSARLVDGSPVAVKIQYPGIADAVESDLKNAGSMARTLSAVMPNAQSKIMVEDFLARIGVECDYQHEADSMLRFANLWSGDRRVLIPSVHTELSTQRVLVTELMQGQTLDDVVRAGDRSRNSAIGEVLFDFVFVSLLRHGVFNADPHPGNFLFPGDDRVVFLDFGCVQTFDEDSRIAFRMLIHAILGGMRGDALWAAMVEAMEFPEDVSPPLREIIERYVLYCFEPALGPQPYRYTRDYTTRLSKLTMDAKMTIAKNLLRIGWREPRRRGLVLLSRILFGLNSLLASLEAEADWRAKLLAI